MLWRSGEFVDSLRTTSKHACRYTYVRVLQKRKRCTVTQTKLVRVQTAPKSSLCDTSTVRWPLEVVTGRNASLSSATRSNGSTHFRMRTLSIGSTLHFHSHRKSSVPGCARSHCWKAWLTSQCSTPASKLKFVCPKKVLTKKILVFALYRLQTTMWSTQTKCVQVMKAVCALAYVLLKNAGSTKENCICAVYSSAYRFYKKTLSPARSISPQCEWSEGDEKGCCDFLQCKITKLNHTATVHMKT